MNRLYVSHVVQSLIILLVQVLLLKNVQIPVLDRYTLAIIIYPMVIIFLPLEMRRSFVILTAFVVGMFVDIFYDTLGIHTAALLLTGFLRTPILQLIEPRQGFRNAVSLSARNYGFSWVAGYTAIMLIIHIITFYSIDAFTFVFFIKIVLSSLLTFLASYIIIMLYKALV